MLYLYIPQVYLYIFQVSTYSRSALTRIRPNLSSVLHMSIHIYINYTMFGIGRYLLYLNLIVKVFLEFRYFFYLIRSFSAVCIKKLATSLYIKYISIQIWLKFPLLFFKNLWKFTKWVNNSETGNCYSTFLLSFVHSVTILLYA